MERQLPAIGRALLLVGALAGMTLGQAAQAQVAFRSAASSTALAPQFRSATSGTLTIVAFRSASAGFLVGAGALAVPRPAAMAVNDVLIAAVAVRPIASTITPVEAGWTLIRRVDNAVANANSLAIYRKVITNLAAEPAANYTFTIAGGATHATGGIQAFSGVDNTNPVDVENGQNTPNAANHATPTITTTVANTFVVATFSFASADAWAPVTAGLTERFDVASPAAVNAVGQTTSGATRAQAARALVAAQSSATGGTVNDVGNTHILALRPALRINAPAGVLVNDVLIASVGIQPSTAVITPPAGWTLVRRDNQALATSNSLAIYQKIATGAEPAFYDFTVATTDFAVGGIQAFFNVDTTTPVNVQAGTATASASAHTAPAVTPTVPNTMLVTSHTYASSQNWAFPGGMTESFDQTSGAAGAAGQAIEGNREYIAAGGVGTGTRTATAAGATPDVGNASTLALQSPRPRLTINVPAGTVANDQMIAAISVQPSAATVTPPAGWTLLRQVNNATATTNSLYVYRRTATGAEPASYTWDFAAWANGYAAGGIQSFSGVDTTTPVDVNGAGQNSNGLNHTATTVNTTVANTMVVTSHAYASSGTFAAPAGMTEAYDVAALTVPNAAGQSIAGYYVTQAAAGATGNKTATASGDGDQGNAHILALRPAPPPPPVAGGFNAYETSTAAGAITGVIKTKIAGSIISLDMIALNLAKTAIETTFTGTVRIEVLNASDNSGALDANSCRPSWTVIQTLSPDPAFTDGRDPISFTQANSYPEARLRITFPAGAPTVTGCSTDNFAIRPDTFNNVAAQDATWQTAGNTRSLANVAATGGNVHKAGRPFRITAQAINGAGSPVATTNYSGSPTAVLTSLLQPSSGCGGCTVGTLTLGTWSAASGVVTTDTASYNEAGSFAMRLEDQSFAAVDAGDGSSTAERYIVGPSINVGRFVPERFVLSSSTTPQYKTFNAIDAACQTPPSGPQRSFTYVGQAFGYATAPSVTITAERFGGGTTANYSGNLWVATLNGPTYSNNAVGPALDTSVATTNLTVNNNGTATLAIGGSLAYSRSATTPIAPFNANISITTDASNSAENAVAGNGIIVSSGALVFNGSGSGIAFDGGDFNLATDDGKTFVYGRAKLQNASGPPGSDLPIPFTIEHYTGSQFVTNARDHCTSFVAGNFLLLGYSGGITAGNMPLSNISTSGSIVSGAGTLRLLKPTSPPATPGRVRICLDLGADAATPGTPACVATSAAKSWLQGRWSETNYDDDPFATAVFGLYGQPRNFIFFRENY